MGAVAPSGPGLAHRMVEGIDFKTARTIVEYGPGTGVFTDRIIRRKRDETHLMMIERNGRFHKKLTRRYAGAKNVHVIHGSAEEVQGFLDECGLATPEYILSGLPFSSLPGTVSESILETTRRILGTEGRFIAFQYSKYRLGFFERHFSHITLRRVFLNIPPAYVLTCTNPASPA